MLDLLVELGAFIAHAQVKAFAGKCSSIPDPVVFHSMNTLGWIFSKCSHQAIVESHQQWEERAIPIWHAVAEEIEAEAEAIVEDVDWPEPKDADDYDDPLFDSTRDYVDQIDRYKAFQGKTTERKPLGPRRGK
jgi:hypothetical protein